MRGLLVLCIALAACASKPKQTSPAPEVKIPVWEYKTPCERLKLMYRELSNTSDKNLANKYWLRYCYKRPKTPLQVIG